MSKSSYKNLTVWQQSLSFVTDIYNLTNQLPKTEIYTLTSQMRRAAISIPSNIAEGQGKKSRKDFIRFLNISLGSASELETQLLLVTNLYKITTDTYIDNLIIIKKMLNALINKLCSMS